MEKVWKDINLSTLHDRHGREGELSANPQIHLRRPNPAVDFLSVHLQDFLARPFAKDSSTSYMVSTGMDSGIYGSGSPPPSPATMLSLNSNRDFHFPDSQESGVPSLHFQSQPIPNAASFNSPFDVLASSSGVPPSAKKRFRETETNNSGDRRHERMIKNRESASRSRARKQAYTNELELEIAHLMEENARLKKQQDLFCPSAAAQVPKKRGLQRTLTAPF